jgi:hypothetical protein
MKTILHWDPRFPVARPVRLELDDAVASAFVRAGVAAPANQADAAALQTGGALDPGNMVEIIIWSGPGKEKRRVFAPGAVAEIAIAAGAATYPATSTAAASTIPPEGYDFVLLIGQSGQVGRYGPVDPVLDATDPRILQYGYNGQTIVLAQDPLDHRDEGPNTVGMGMSYAKARIAAGLLTGNRKIVLIPAAQGATGFSNSFWTAGGSGDTGAIARANAAMAQVAAPGGVNRLVAILWHGGEADAALSEAAYAAHLDALIARLRSSIAGASETTPFVCGGTLVGGSQTAAGVSAALANLPTRVSYTGYAPSTGLVSGGDNLHMSAASQRTFGGRYFTAGQSALTNVVTPPAPGVPSAITDLVATPGDGQVTLSHSAPANNGSAITDYIYEYKTAAGETYTVFVDGTSATPGAVIPATNGTPYNFRAYAANEVGPSLASNVATATPAEASDAEAAAVRHWLLGSDNPDMLDLKAGAPLTPVGADLVDHDGYVTTNGLLGGARSDIPVAASQTVIVVARCPTGFAGMIAGSLSSTQGASIFGAAGGVRAMNARPINDNTGLGSFTSGEWVFMALSYSNGVSRVDYIGNATAPVVKTNPTVSTDASGVGTTNLIGIGDVGLNSASLDDICDVAELIIIPGPQTVSQLHAIYDNSVARLAPRGIPVS